MKQYENKYYALGYIYVLGLDEAGRGPLAGPLVVAGVCFDETYENDAINDSKKLSDKKRAALYDRIIEDAVFYSIEIVDVETIDQLNIYQATKQAMMKISQEQEIAKVILSDAMPFELDNKIVEPIIKGDQKSISIAAASILAKVTRDRIMTDYDTIYPEYGFKKHKGYPTKQHIAALEQYGVLEIHRTSYRPVAICIEKNKE